MVVLLKLVYVEILIKDNPLGNRSILLHHRIEEHKTMAFLKQWPKIDTKQIADKSNGYKVNPKP
ncbi:hypothetical protein ACRRVA_03110 [Candidatus Cardinium hertigii]|uniref:hypothetical protein n=1 Tax=Candidatus Cardinium hertigii TaxID=247481 RepID=UPI003D7DD677